MTNQTTVAKDVLIGQPNPTVSLHVVVDERESSIGRLLDDVGEFADEIHLVLAETTEAAKREIEERLIRYPWIEKTIQRVTPASHPDLYLHDTRSTYLAGTSLDGEVLEGPFSERPLLTDRGAARNITSKSSSCDWRLHLEPDDWVVSPSEIIYIVQLASQCDADVVSTRYTREYNVLSVNPAWREILTRNLPSIVWTGKTRPSPTGHSVQIGVENFLAIGNRRQETTADLDRNFKLLYHEARTLGWNVSAPHLENMILDSIRLATASPLPIAWTAGPLFDRYSKIAGQEEEARVRLLAGEIYFKLAKIAFERGEWSSCIKNYEAGCRASSSERPEGNMRPTNLETATQLLVAMAYNILGNKAKAREHIDEVSKARMNDPAVTTIWKKIYEIPSETTDEKPE